MPERASEDRILPPPQGRFRAGGILKKTMKIRAFLMLLISTAISSGTFFFPVLAATNQGRLWSSGSELNSLTADVEIEAVGGTGSRAIVSSPVRSGTYALQTSSANPPPWGRYRFAEA